MESNDVHKYENGSSFEALIGENGRAKSNNDDWQTMVYPRWQREQQVKQANSADLDKVKSNGDGKSIF